jgi:chromosomal replication initiator protein
MNRRSLLRLALASPAALMPSLPEKEIRRVEPKRSNLEPRFTFENFDFSRCAFTLKDAREIAESQNPIPRWIVGRYGKTHLLQAFGNAIEANHPEYNIFYVGAEDFAHQLVKAVRFDSADLFRNYYRNLDVLLLDDHEYFTERPYATEEFLYTMRALKLKQKYVFIARHVAFIGGRGREQINLEIER